MQCVKSSGIYWEDDFHPMILESPCYQAPIAWLIYLLGITEYDQAFGRVINGVLHCVVHLPSCQAYWADGVLLVLIWEAELIQDYQVPNGILACFNRLEGGVQCHIIL